MPGQDHIDKDQLLVELEQNAGPVLYGFLFIVRSGRVQDILNDERVFLPFQHVGGKMVMLAKSNISNIVEIVNITAVEFGNGPYNSLGVSRQDDLEVIENHYQEMIRRCHPDRYAGERYPYHRSRKIWR